MSYPVDNQIICRFAFTTRPLTIQEQADFEAGKGLPATVGFDPPVVKFDSRLSSNPVATLTGSNVTRDNVGEYHVILDITDGGSWVWRGYGQESDGTPVAATAAQSFFVTGF